MFNLSVKQSFWINLILGLVFSYMFVAALLHFNILGIILHGVFAYLCISALHMNHWKPRDYPFNNKVFNANNNTKRW